VVESLPDAWPACDDRCGGRRPHDRDLRVVLADLNVVQTHRRDGGWWHCGVKTEIEREPEWEAVGPATAETPAEARLPRLTRLRCIATTDCSWGAICHPLTPVFEDLHEILDGPFAGGQLVTVRYRPSDIDSGLAGKLVVPDHPPARDPGAADRRLAGVDVYV
jgi:hypothetical protein